METSGKEFNDPGSFTTVTNATGIPINCNENSTLESIAEDENIQRNPMQNPLIIYHVFSYLSLDDIKATRLICKKWNDLSVSYLDKISLIRIGYPEKVNAPAFEEMSPNNFKEFSENSQRIFRAFKLESFPNHEASWPVHILEEFLEDQSQIMEELTIDNINIKGYKNNHIYHFSISPCISRNLSHLAIDSSLNSLLGGSNFIVSTNKLTSVRSLSFTHCAVNVLKQCKLSPEKLKLKYVDIVKNGEPMSHQERFMVNNFIDFKNLKELTLKCRNDTPDRDDEGIDTLLLIDMSGKRILDALNLTGIKIDNFKESHWQINKKFKLNDIPFREETKMKFTELHFGHETIHLDALPAFIEKLVIRMEEVEYFLGMPTNVVGSLSLAPLPNLKCLELLTDVRDEQIRFLACLSLFTGCKNLTTIKLDSKAYENINSDWIPPSTKNLFLTGNFRVNEGEEVKLERLVIQDNNLDAIIDTLTRLTSKHLVLDLNSEFLEWTENLDQIILALINMPYDSLTIGSLDINETKFRESSFSKHVDQRAKCYRFKNKIGMSIVEWEFRGMKREQYK